ncbi:dienelactone hydrolase family protein [Bombardia bombarda]|uniref:Dienelactone hydrolase family protein n=1 Tax=Bombardia bombarda TaxID=252184 RepID=A0AA39X8M9_9PEZI|nr:dienelactone hydrolase family protein [Bombardia bombarda]
MSCPDCFSGSVHEGQPRGSIIKLHGLDTYLVEPQDGKPIKGIIVMIPEAFGWSFVNNRILADHYANKSSYRVYLPDFMLGHSAPPRLLGVVRSLSSSSIFMKPFYLAIAMVSFIPWIYYNRIARSYPVVKAFFTALRQSAPTSPTTNAPLPIGAAGFCWGGKHVVLLSQNETTTLADGTNAPLIDAGFTGHPSFLEIPGDIEKLTVPVSFAIAEKDHRVGPKEAEIIRGIVVDGPGFAQDDAKKGEVTVYEDAGHGFCVRADVRSGTANVARQAEEAEDQCLRWFDRVFGV